MSFLVERLAELRRHLDHLRDLRPRVGHAGALATDLSLHNDVLFSLFMVCQAVIDIAGELAARHGIRFQDYAGAVRALRQIEGIPSDPCSPICIRVSWVMGSISSISCGAMLRGEHA